MFILRAPYPYIATTTVMPSPAWSDSKALAATVTTMRAVDGTLYSYVTTRAGRKRFIWTFEIARHKALELREAGHFVQEWGDIVAKNALEHFKL